MFFVHARIVHLRDYILSRFHHINLHRRIKKFQCLDCQRYKIPGQRWGELALREANLVPWEEVAIDIIGPWTIDINGKTFEFNALTCIDPVTNLT